MTKIIHTEKAPAAIGPYVQAVDLGNLVLTSGQIPVNPANGEVSERYCGTSASIFRECESDY